jgi:hypothetical protein
MLSEARPSICVSQPSPAVAEVLQSAREALLAYAATDANRPGALPCPDIDGDGRALPGIEYVGNGCQSYIGRLPWALLRIPELRDASGDGAKMGPITVLLTNVWYCVVRMRTWSAPVAASAASASAEEGEP